MSTGKINVTSDNIFPIIKKFLYSDHEIFLRELIANGMDATNKLKALSSIGEAKGELGELKVEVIADKEANTLTIKDHGIGMTAEEVDKYINQIAFSGAEEFVSKFKDQTDTASIIGKFGLGFYSGFMVAEKIEIKTLSYQDDAQAVRWECDGSPEYTLEDTVKTDRGTEIILHIDEDSKDFLEDWKINELLTKYCKFLPVPVQFGTKEITNTEGEGEEAKETKETVNNIINNTHPAWTKAPSELTDEDYKSFYRELYPMAPEPLFWIHLNVDFPFNLTGILYFPKLSNNFEIEKDKIQLYCRQVFVTDSTEGIVPDFLMMLKGVIDSPDIPLNVSRSYLQADGAVKKISSYITKKVSDKLAELFKKDRADFESKWDDIKTIIQYGMLSDEKFYDRATKYALLKNTADKCFTFDEYKTHIEATQKNKEDKLVHLYTSNKEEQYTYIKAATDKGYDVLIMDGVTDNHFVNHLEQKFENSAFTRVDADTIDKLIDKDEKYDSVLSEDQQNELKPLIDAQVEGKDGMFNVEFGSLSPEASPIQITRPEFMRRMADMSKLGGGMAMMGNMPESYNVVVNSNHPLVSKIVKEGDSSKKETLIGQTLDLALLSQNLLKGEELSKFINRSLELID
jgi:molecular chaperone HtpG